MSISNYQAKLVKKQKLTDKIYVLRFEFENPEKMEFIPGQFASVLVDKNIRRSYSMSSSDVDDKFMETIIDITPNGPGTKFFMDLDLGGDLGFLAPLGTFTYIPAQNTPVVFLATGTGIAPFWSMFDYIYRNEPEREVYFYWGLRSEEDIYLGEELKKYKELMPNFNYEICLSQPSNNWKGKKGYCTQGWLDDWKEMGDTFVKAEYYLCGGGDMVQDAISLLDDKNVEGSVYYERYY